MISLLRWKEFGSPNSPSVKETFEKTPYQGQKAIIRYLKNGKVKLAAAGCSFDAFTGEVISPRKEILTDGEYSWNTAIIYYVEKYNMRLPMEFESKILGN